MNVDVWLLIIISVITLILGISAVFLSIFKKKKKVLDFYAVFIIGFVWLITGIPIQNYILSLIGLIFFVLGLYHKDDWDINKTTWSNLGLKEKIMKITLIGTLIIILISGIIIYFLN